MNPFSSPYIKVQCPNGPRFLLKDPGKAFSIIVPNFDARMKTLIDFFTKATADVDVNFSKRATAIVKDLTENYALLQAHYQMAYMGLWTNPCSPDSTKAYTEAIAKICNKEFLLRELENKTMIVSVSKELPKEDGTYCPNCAGVAVLRKHWTMAGRKDKMGRRMLLEIGLFKCPNCGNSFRKVIRKKQLLKESKEKGEIPVYGSEFSRAEVPEKMDEIDTLVSKLKP